MAPFGQNSWQQKHFMHLLLSIEGISAALVLPLVPVGLTMVIAFAGQVSKHFLQPIHSDVFRIGLVLNTAFMATDFTVFKKPPPSKVML